MSTSVSMSKHGLAMLLVASGLGTQAAPLERDGELQPRKNENTHITTGEPPSDRTIFVMISISCVAVLAFLLGSRVHRLKRCIRSRRNFTAPLLLAMYITVICYIIVAAALVSGQGLYTYQLCDAGTWVCLMFYIMAKGFIYFFLCERVHIVRAPFVRRSKDKVYLACVIPAFTLYLIISVNSYFWRVTAMHDSDGRCHFGISSEASIPVLSVNILSNVCLTGVFIYLLRPVIKLYRVPTVSAALEKKNTKMDAETPTIQPSTTNESAVQKNIKTLLWKSILGAILTELPVAANMIQFFITGGAELGMMCLTFCMVDVFWDALVIHWLTFGSSAAAEKDLMRSTQATQTTQTTQTTQANSQQGSVKLGVSETQQMSEPSRCSSRREMEIQGVEAPESAYKFSPGFDVAFRKDSAVPP